MLMSDIGISKGARIVFTYQVRAVMPRGTWAVRYTLDGQDGTAVNMDQVTAHAIVADYTTNLPGCTAAVAVDLLAELEARYPLGSEVIHRTSRRRATVVSEMHCPMSNKPAGEPAWAAVDHRGGGLVCIRFHGEGHHLTWFTAGYILPGAVRAAEPLITRPARRVTA